MTDLLLRAERALVDGVLRPAAVAVADGVITAVTGITGGDDAVGGADVVEVTAPAVLLPGFVDTHVHVDEPGTDWEGFATATAAAAAAGITTIVDMPLDCDPVTTTVTALAAKRAVARGNCHVDVGFWAGAVPANVGALAPLAAAGAVGFKCFLADSGNPDFGHLKPDEFLSAATEVAALSAVLLVHAESHAVLAESPAPHGRRYDAFLRSRPDEAELAAVRLVVDVARRTGARLHVVHVSSATVLPLLAAARAEGLAVTAETCPHYLGLAAEDVPDGAVEYAACPPIRDRANREALWAALADGTLDMVVSDHSPCAPTAKGRDFGTVFGGIGSLELAPRVTWTHAAARGFGIADLSRWMSQRPAALAGYRDRGRIAVGARADLCVFDPDVWAPVRAAESHQRHPGGPYDGTSLRGAAVRTWVAGVAVPRRTPQPVTAGATNRGLGA